MGGTTIYVEQEGMSMREAFRTAQDNAREEYGSDYYNGQINNGWLARDLTATYNTLRTKKQKSDFIDDKMDNADKGDVYGVCIVQPKQGNKKQGKYMFFGLVSC